MSAQFPNGTIFSISTTLAAAKTVTAISTANPGVAAAVANGYANGDILMMNAVSSRIDKRVVRAASIATDAFALEGIDTTNTALYPSGFGVGSAQKATALTPISQVTDVSSAGGEQQFFQWVYLEDGRQRQRPTFKNARSMTLVMDYDPALAWHAALLLADQLGTEAVLLALLPSGAKLYYSVFVGFDGEPSFTINQNQQTTCSLSLACPFSTRYAS